MFGSKKLKKTKKAKKESESIFFLWSGDFWTHTLFKVLVAAFVAAGGWLALAAARDQAVKIEDFQISPGNLDFISKPEWVTGPIERQLRSFSTPDAKISLLDSDAAKRIAAALSANPWIKKVESIEKDFPATVRAKVELREPAAYVLRGSRYYLVDGVGTRLPGEYASRRETGLDDLLLIVYVRSTPPPAGKTWGDPAVVEAAKLASYLKDHEDLVKRARIGAIDSSNFGGRRSPRESEIVLLTSDHTKIYWGRGVDTANYTELSPERKIENLERVMTQEGALSDKEYVDVRFGEPAFRDRSYYLGSR